MNRISKYCLSSVFAAGLLAACAGMESGGPVEARQAVMKSNNANMKAIGAFVRDGTGSAADVARRARKLAANVASLKGLFPKGTSLSEMPGKTRAKDDIWKKPAAFEQAAAIFIVYANRLAEAADSGDRAAIGTAMGVLGKRGCAGCHGEFRGPKPKS